MVTAPVCDNDLSIRLGWPLTNRLPASSLARLIESSRLSCPIGSREEIRGAHGFSIPWSQFSSADPLGEHDLERDPEKGSQAEGGAVLAAHPVGERAPRGRAPPLWAGVHPGPSMGKAQAPSAEFIEGEARLLRWSGLGGSAHGWAGRPRHELAWTCAGLQPRIPDRLPPPCNRLRRGLSRHPTRRR